ncbi:uncharacterized protein F5147DRAFT_651865 [Suillus discolor]|uniref:Uncharacterized protein n=1 Tax=Suillus discolor TaxID=1912936 RepID=A0A9P7JV51_9AGAM|nr:uncharacterized protein F5147DRAFT_651865 [Suillus discolor]KAG2110213.1 hypothetical protein F5147DRAFT_651865 [Suillus discolor]
MKNDVFEQGKADIQGEIKYEIKETGRWMAEDYEKITKGRKRPLRDSKTGEWETGRTGRRETGDGRRETGDGRRETGDGRRETGDGRRETGDGRRETGDGRWETGDGRREMGDGRRETGDGRRETGGREK